MTGREGTCRAFIVLNLKRVVFFSMSVTFRDVYYARHSWDASSDRQE